MSDGKEKTYMSIWVTKDFKRQIEFMADNERAKETLIKEYLEKEAEFIKAEIKGIDDIVLLYRSKLVDIRDGFGKAQEVYNEELDALSAKTWDSLHEFDKKFKVLADGIESIKDKGRDLYKIVDGYSKSINNINVGSLERLLDAVDRFNNMTDKEKELITLIIKG